MAATPDELLEITGYFPEFWSEAAHLYTETLYEAVKLDRKTIELILCALLAARRWETGVQVHSGLALAHGASPAEVRGALLMSMAVAGTSAAASGLHWAEPVIAEAEGAEPRTTRGAAL
jgi:alkylhydroperoxidase/carboxymuconolactone decarboxylase family protein YurZ